jgi:hypothetical protein
MNTARSAVQERAIDIGLPQHANGNVQSVALRDRAQVEHHAGLEKPDAPGGIIQFECRTSGHRDAESAAGRLLYAERILEESEGVLVQSDGLLDGASCDMGYKTVRCEASQAAVAADDLVQSRLSGGAETVHRLAGEHDLEASRHRVHSQSQRHPVGATGRP